MYKVVLPKKIEAGASETINVEYVLVQSLVPFPEQITQEETQLVKKKQFNCDLYNVIDTSCTLEMPISLLLIQSRKRRLQLSLEAASSSPSQLSLLANSLERRLYTVPTRTPLPRLS